MSKIIIVYITNPNMAVAKKVAEHLLKKRLIGCANFWPVNSVYSWKGKIANEKEVVALVKSTPANWNRIKIEVKKIHPYSVPCVIKLPAEANAEFAQWVNKEVR